VRLTFLGTGTSFGVPQLGCACMVCRSADPRDKRTRVGALVESGPPPADRHAARAADAAARRARGPRGCGALHARSRRPHARHRRHPGVLGARDGALPLYGPAETLDALARRFAYIFDPRLKPLPGTSKTRRAAHPLEPGVAARIGHLDVTPVAVPHGRHARVRLSHRAARPTSPTPSHCRTSARAAAGRDVLVLNALFRRAHPTHLSVGEAVEAARRVGARAHLPHAPDARDLHADLAATLPPGVSPAYDGLTVEIHDA
jgi:phosphoribosyl 1,2-cyclic phosphate phosphodiesterase